jgi:hypothetical protein
MNFDSMLRVPGSDLDTVKVGKVPIMLVEYEMYKYEYTGVSKMAPNLLRG